MQQSGWKISIRLLGWLLLVAVMLTALFANGVGVHKSATAAPSPQVRIHDIQGNKFISPFITTTVQDNKITYGATVTAVPGIVTAVGNSGFYFQDPNPDSDPATSEGIYVYTGSSPVITVGDSVLVTGTVEEYRQGCTSASCTSSSSAWEGLVTTELGSSKSKVSVVSSGNALPAPIIVGQGGLVPPNTTIASPVISGNVEAVMTYTLQPSLYGLDYWRSLEGMRVVINNAVAVEPTRLYGSATPASCETANNNCEIAVVPDGGADNVLTSPYGGVVSTANNYNPQRIILNNILNPSHPSFMPEVNVGAEFSQPITGVIDYNFENFKLIPTQDLPSTTGGAVRDVLSDALSNPTSSQLNIATFNVENLAPSDPDGKYQGLASIVVNNLKSPDIIAVEEIQDNDGATDDGVVAADQTYAKLISFISQAGGPTYQYRQIDPVNDQDGGQPGGNIRQGFLFRTDRGLTFVDRASSNPSTTTDTVTTVNGKPELTYSPGRVSPTDDAAWASSRKPLAGEFSFNGRTLFVIANHFIAKLGDQPLFGRFQPPAQASEAQRILQAQDVAAFVQQILAIDPNAAIAVVGDLNDYQYSQAVQILDNAGLHDLITTLPANQQFTYDFEGNSQVLDHILVSNGLFKGSADQYQSVHVNSLFYDQTSDHDPSVAQLDLPVVPIITTTTYSYYLPFLSNNGAGANIVNTRDVSAKTSTYNTYVSVENSSNASAVFTITYYSTTGSIIGTDNNGGNAIAPNNRYIPTSPLANGQNASAMVVSSQPLNIVVSESGTVNGKATASSYTAINTTTDAASTIYAPIALNNSYGGYTTNFVVANLGISSTTATIQYYNDNGTSAGSQSVSLAANAETNILQSDAAANLPSGFSGWAIITSSGNQPLAGQVVETNPNFSFLETVDMPGMSGKTLFIPTVFQNAFGNFNTGMQLVNPNGTTANVTVTYYRKDGTKITASNNHGSFTIGANSDKSFYHDLADFPELNTPNGGFVGTAVITSDQPLIAVVNQAGSLNNVQYNGAFGTVLNGAAKVSVPVAVKNSYGYTTGLQVSNISNVASTATLTYYDTKGNKVYSTTLKSDAGGAIPAYGSVNPYLGIENNLPNSFDGIAVVTADTNGAQFIVIANNASSNFFYTFANNS